MKRVEAYDAAARALRRAEKRAQKGDLDGAEKWRVLAEEWRLLANDTAGRHDVGFLRRKVD